MEKKLIFKNITVDPTGFYDDSGVYFNPFRKIADKIDDCLSLISYHKFFGNIADAMKKEEELKSLREEIIKIKKGSSY